MVFIDACGHLAVVVVVNVWVTIIRIDGWGLLVAIYGWDLLEAGVATGVLLPVAVAWDLRETVMQLLHVHLVLLRCHLLTPLAEALHANKVLL